MLYKVQIDDKDIYNAIREYLGEKAQHNFKTNWLPNPKEKLYTFVTEEEYKHFKEIMLPLFQFLLPILIYTIANTNSNLIYSDK